MSHSLLSILALFIVAIVLPKAPSLDAQIVYEISGTLQEADKSISNNIAGLDGATLVVNASYDYPHVWYSCGFGPFACTQTFSSSTTVTISSATINDSNGVFTVEHQNPYVVWHSSLPPNGAIVGVPGLDLLGGNLVISINLIVPGNEGPLPGEPILLEQFIPAQYEKSEIQFFDSPNESLYEFVPGTVKIFACILGDVNSDGVVDLLDIQPFVELINAPASFQCEADINQDGVVNLLDVDPLVELLIGN